MKHIILLILAGVLLIGFNACEPNADIYDELNDNDSTYLADMNKMEPVPEYTLTMTDYELSSNEDVVNFHNFSDYSPAADYLPEIINKLFLIEAGAEMTVYFDFYESVISMGDTIAIDTVEVDEYPGDYPNFSDYDDIYEFLSENYSPEEEGEFVILTYDWYQWYAGSVETKTTVFVFLGEEDWTKTYKLVKADYFALGQSYPNISEEDAAEKIPNYVGNLVNDIYNFLDAQAGDNAYVTFETYNGSPNYDLNIVELIKSEAGWNVVESVNQKSAEFTSGSDTWNMVPPIDFIMSTGTHNKEYTLTDADYELVGNGQYHNFDEDEATVLEKISTVLKAHPELEIVIGDIILVHYDYYNGSVIELEMTLEAIAAE